MKDFNCIFNHLLHHENKTKNDKKTIFAFSSKEEIQKGKGICFPNLNHFFYHLKHKPSVFTHWTPNFYNHGYLNEDGRLFGHSENNLFSINTFVVDIDSKAIDHSAILRILNQNHLCPTLILNTPKGFHLYFVLKSSIFKSKLSEAKNLSLRLREEISLLITGVDTGCNHFGIFRFPTSKNILYFKKENSYDFLELSKRYLKKEPSPTLANSSFEDNIQINTGWFRALSSIKKPKQKTQIGGRNNLLFTLSLACFSSRLSYNEAKTRILKYNNNFTTPLLAQEVIKTLNSAYSGRYKGASKYHVKRLLKLNKPDLFLSKSLFWYKNKKTRAARKHTYIYEWKTDFLIWFFKNSTKENPKIKITAGEISKETKIPESSLKLVFKELEDENKIIKRTKKGRGGYTLILYLPNVINNILDLKKKKAKEYQIFKRIIESMMKNQKIKNPNLKPFLNSLRLSSSQESLNILIS